MRIISNTIDHTNVQSIHAYNIIQHHVLTASHCPKCLFANCSPALHTTWLPPHPGANSSGQEHIKMIPAFMLSTCIIRQAARERGLSESISLRQSVLRAAQRTRKNLTWWYWMSVFHQASLQMFKVLKFQILSVPPCLYSHQTTCMSFHVLPVSLPIQRGSNLLVNIVAALKPVWTRVSLKHMKYSTDGLLGTLSSQNSTARKSAKPPLPPLRQPRLGTVDRSKVGHTWSSQQWRTSRWQRPRHLQVFSFQPVNH